MKKSWTENEKRVIQYLVEESGKLPEIERALLFGSRSRRDAGERSDFDVAIFAPGLSHTKWAVWANEVKENVPTLCGLDLTLVTDTLAQGFREAINRDGYCIYDKNQPSELK